MAGCLEDLSTTNSGDSGESERLLSDNEWEKIQTVHQQVALFKNWVQVFNKRMRLYSVRLS